MRYSEHRARYLLSSCAGARSAVACGHAIATTLAKHNCCKTSSNYKEYSVTTYFSRLSCYPVCSPSFAKRTGGGPVFVDGAAIFPSPPPAGYLLGHRGSKNKEIAWTQDPGQPLFLPHRPWISALLYRERGRRIHRSSYSYRTNYELLIPPRQTKTYHTISKSFGGWPSIHPSIHSMILGEAENGTGPPIFFVHSLLCRKDKYPAHFFEGFPVGEKEERSRATPITSDTDRFLERNRNLKSFPAHQPKT